MATRNAYGSHVRWLSHSPTPRRQRLPALRPRKDRRRGHYVVLGAEPGPARDVIVIVALSLGVSTAAYGLLHLVTALVT